MVSESRDVPLVTEEFASIKQRRSVRVLSTDAIRTSDTADHSKVRACRRRDAIAVVGEDRGDIIRARNIATAIRGDIDATHARLLADIVGNYE